MNIILSFFMIKTSISKKKTPRKRGFAIS